MVNIHGNIENFITNSEVSRLVQNRLFDISLNISDLAAIAQIQYIKPQAAKRCFPGKTEYLWGEVMLSDQIVEKRGALNRGIWREDKQLITPSF